MKNRVLMASALLACLVLSGCGLLGPYELGGESMLTLDQAIGRATGRDDLYALMSQASQIGLTDDKAIIEQELLKVSSRAGDISTIESLRRTASTKEVSEAATDTVRAYEQAREEEAKRVREEQQVEAQRKGEEIRLAMKENRRQLFQEAGGRLNDKSAEDVKRLIDNWRTPQGSLQVNPYDYDVWQQYVSDFKDSLHANSFYKAFGQPQRKQLIADHYYFYYECTDGTAQIEIDADSLSKENLVLVSGLNIL